MRTDPEATRGDALLPCPFCPDGGEPVLAHLVIQAKKVVECFACRTTGPQAETQAEATAAWNRRARPTGADVQSVAPPDTYVMPGETVEQAIDRRGADVLDGERPDLADDLALAIWGEVLPRDSRTDDALHRIADMIREATAKLRAPSAPLGTWRDILAEHHLSDAGLSSAEDAVRMLAGEYESLSGMVRAYAGSAAIAAAPVGTESVEEFGFGIVYPRTGRRAWSETYPADLAQVVPGVRIFALSSIQPGRSPVGWQTMESAPKDGTQVLLYSPDADPLHARFIGEYDADFPGPDRDGAWIDPLSCDSLDAWPTHWMPLPAPPAGGEPTEDPR